MEIIIDQEFKDLIAPLTAEEHSSLEKNLLENGFNKAYPLILWKNHNILVDGHNRFGLCTKYGIEFTTVEQEFSSREAVIDWMVDNQLSRRSIDAEQRAYLIGKKYNTEKSSRGGLRSKCNECTLPTDAKIAEEFGISSRTVKNDSTYFNAVEKICGLMGISRQELMKNHTMKDIIALAKLPDEECKSAIENFKNAPEITRSESFFPICFKLDKGTNTRLKKLAGKMSVQDYIVNLINSEWESNK